MIEVRELSKRFGATTALHPVTFDVAPGVVTGLLGPNGAGKSTLMRMMLGLDRPTGGSVTIRGRPLRASEAPMREVGALLDARAVQGGRTARGHLRWLARAGGIGPARVEELLGLVGLAEVAGRRIGGFSLGMSQRLGIAAALLGDPAVVLLDEPGNGLDPEGVLWVRTLLRRLAGEGRVVLVSSHQMNEMQHSADHVLVLGRGRLIADTDIDSFTRAAGDGGVRVVSPDADALAAALAAEGAAVAAAPGGVLRVTGITAERIGDLAAARGLRLHELTPRRASLEAAFVELTRDSVQYATTPPPPPPPPPSAADVPVAAGHPGSERSS